MEIYLYKSRKGQAIGSLLFLKDALKKYSLLHGLNENTLQVFKNEKGKPEVSEDGIYVSASHSGEWVACAISNSEVGIDIQNERAIDGIRVLKRFGTEEERAYSNIAGAKGFFEIWCIKEAYSKFDGEGISYGFGRIKTCVEEDNNGEKVFKIADDINGVKISCGRLPFDNSIHFAVAGEGTIEWKFCDWLENEKI